jgi:hypothetical protein
MVRHQHILLLSRELPIDRRDSTYQLLEAAYGLVPKEAAVSEHSGEAALGVLVTNVFQNLNMKYEALNRLEDEASRGEDLAERDRNFLEALRQSKELAKFVQLKRAGFDEVRDANAISQALKEKGMYESYTFDSPRWSYKERGIWSIRSDENYLLAEQMAQKHGGTMHDWYDSAEGLINRLIREPKMQRRCSPARQ